MSGADTLKWARFSGKLNQTVSWLYCGGRMHICGRASLGVVSVCFGAALALSGARASAKQAPSPASPSPSQAVVQMLHHLPSKGAHRRCRPRHARHDESWRASVWERVVEKLRAGSMPPRTPASRQRHL